MSAGRWAAGLAVSALAHAAGFGALLLTVEPEEVGEQPTPPSKLDVQAYQLDRAVAPEARPEAPAAAEAATQGAEVAAGAIPRSQAKPAAIAPRELPAEPPRPETLAASAAPPPRVDPVTATAAQLKATSKETARLKPEAVRPQTVSTSGAQARPLPAVRAEPAVLRADAAHAAAIPAVAATASALAPAASAADRLSAALSAPAPITESVPVPASLGEAEPTPASLIETRPITQSVQPGAPDAPAIAPGTPEADALPDMPAPSQPLAAAASDAEPTEAATPQVQPVKATLAFPGGDGDIDPASLAAFQSFMRPGDFTAEGDPLRDGVSALLSQVPCSRLQVAFDPETATLRINGHVPDDDLRAPVLAALQAQMGADIRVSDNILILPRPQCGALSGIGDVGLPQSNDQSTNPLLIGADTHARVLDFVKDQRLWFEITAPDYDAYVYVDFFDAGGNVLHLAPNDQVPLSLARRDSALRVGTQTDADTGLKILIGPPYGQEIAVAFAASEPLYDGLRPLIEPAAPYLDFLRQRVSAKRAEHPDFKGEWVYFFVTTAER